MSCKAVCLGVPVTLFNYEFLKLAFHYVLACQIMAKKEIGPRPNLIADPWPMILSMVLKPFHVKDPQIDMYGIIKSIQKYG